MAVFPAHSVVVLVVRVVVHYLAAVRLVRKEL
jgi:hypothetical protein